MLFCSINTTYIETISTFSIKRYTWQCLIYRTMLNYNIETTGCNRSTSPNVKRVHSRGKWSTGQHTSLWEEMFIRVQISVARPGQLWRKFKYLPKHLPTEIQISVRTYSVISHCLFPLLIFPSSTLSVVSNMACMLPFLPCLTPLPSLPAFLKLRVHTSHLWSLLCLYFKWVP